MWLQPATVESRRQVAADEHCLKTDAHMHNLQQVENCYAKDSISQDSHC